LYAVKRSYKKNEASASRSVALSLFFIPLCSAKQKRSFIVLWPRSKVISAQTTTTGKIHKGLFFGEKPIAVRLWELEKRGGHRFLPLPRQMSEILTKESTI
jgi:hypothetical protein